jgi:hypothetical protein
MVALDLAGRKPGQLTKRTLEAIKYLGPVSERALAVLASAIARRWRELLCMVWSRRYCRVRTRRFAPGRDSWGALCGSFALLRGAGSGADASHDTALRSNGYCQVPEFCDAW